MDLQSFLRQSPHFSKTSDAKAFQSDWDIRRVPKGAELIQQEAPASKEYILLDGTLTGTITNQNGIEACVGLYVAPGVVPPSIARSRAGISLISIEASTDALIAQMDSDLLTDRMLASEVIRDWANGILREELARKADREWCLTALGGAERLDWFRDRFARYEDIFTHARIASYLGITPVTLSRLRHKEKTR